MQLATTEKLTRRFSVTLLRNRLGISLFSFAALCATPLTGAAENWPQYRGPQRTGIVTEKNLAESWPEKGPTELWRNPTGTGFASPSPSMEKSTPST